MKLLNFIKGLIKKREVSKLKPDKNFEFKEYNHMKVLVDEMQKIVDRANGEVKIQLLSNFLIVQAKYFIGEGIYLDKAKNVYNDVLSGNTPPILRLSAHYYLGLINFKTNNF